MNTKPEHTNPVIQARYARLDAFAKQVEKLATDQEVGFILYAVSKDEASREDNEQAAMQQLHNVNGIDMAEHIKSLKSDYTHVFELIELLNLRKKQEVN